MNGSMKGGGWLRRVLQNLAGSAGSWIAWYSIVLILEWRASSNVLAPLKVDNL